MGQAKSKPPTRVIVTDDTIIADNVNADDDLDVINNNVDTLGVTAEENDYPPPKPQNKQVSSAPIQKPSPAGDAYNPSGIGDKSLETRQEESNKQNDLQIHMLPVGASFQKFFKKPSEVDLMDMEFYDKARSNQLQSVSTYNSSKTISVTRSFTNALAASSSDLSSVGATQPPSGATKRTSMLATRERYETKQYSRATTPARGMKPDRGQVRRFTFSDVINTQCNFTDMEDVLADELADMHKGHRAESYANLIEDLTSQAQTDMLKVKVILSWISKQNIGHIQFFPGDPAPDTPNGYMLLVQNGQGTYPVFFALLCRAAGIKCAIVSGISKGSNYEVGAKESECLRNTWNAALVDDTWQLVHPLWVCRGLSRRRQEGWMTIEKEGKTERSLSIANTGRDVPAFNNYYIFTPPEEFIHRNFPDDEKWQLLPQSISQDEFFAKSYLRPQFFQNNLKLLSDDKCVLESDNGDPVEVVIGYSKDEFPDIVFGYELFLKMEDHREHSEDDQLEEEHQHTERDDSGDRRFVLVRKEETKVVFQIRFYQTGIFKLRIFGGKYSEFGKKPPWIMDVQLLCNAILPQVVPLPFDPGMVGWGPGPVATEQGLYVPSHVDSIVHVTEDEPELVYFVLQQPQDVIVQLQHAEKSIETLTEFVNCDILMQHDVLVLRTVIASPGPGEYALRFDIKRRNRLVNACNYIVHTRKGRPHETYYKRKARRMLLKAMEECDMVELEKALQACMQYGIPDTDPDVVGAKNRLEFLSCKKELYVAMLVHRIDVAEHALYRTRKANLENLLDKEMRRVEAHLKFILQLDEGGWTADVPEIDRLSLVELGQLRSPKLELKLVVTSMYLLLGVNESFLKDWKNVRRLLKDQEATLVEMARLEKYISLEIVDELPIVGKDVLERVEKLIGLYTEEGIRKIDNTAAAYFRWVQNMLQGIAEKHRQLDELYQDDVISPASQMAGKRNSLASNIFKSSKDTLGTASSDRLFSSHSKVVRSQSGKVIVRQHTPGANLSASHVNGRHPHYSRNQQLTNSFGVPQTPISVAKSIPEEVDTLGSLTPISVLGKEEPLRLRLLTARPNNRALTAKATSLNDKRAPSRLLTATSNTRPTTSNTIAPSINGPTHINGKGSIASLQEEHITKTTTLKWDDDSSSLVKSRDDHGRTSTYSGKIALRPKTGAVRRELFKQETFERLPSRNLSNKVTKQSVNSVVPAQLNSRSGTVTLS